MTDEVSTPTEPNNPERIASGNAFQRLRTRILSLPVESPYHMGTRTIQLEDNSSIELHGIAGTPSAESSGIFDNILVKVIPPGSDGKPNLDQTTSFRVESFEGVLIGISIPETIAIGDSVIKRGFRDLPLRVTPGTNRIAPNDYATSLVDWVDQMTEGGAYTNPPITVSTQPTPQA